MPNISHIQRCKALVNAVEVLSQTEIDEMFKLIHQCTNTYFFFNVHDSCI